MSLLQIDVLLKNGKHLEILKLVEKSKKEKLKELDLASLRSLLRECPETWREGQDLINYTTETCIDKFYDSSPAFKEIVKVKIEGLKEDLGFADTCPIERLLISNVALAYLRWIIIGLTSDKILSGSHTTDSGNYWGKQLAGANKHYLKSIEALTKFRKLARVTPGLKRDLVSEAVM